MTSADESSATPSMSGSAPSGPAPSGTGCADCLAGAQPGWWVHLRRCVQCGHVGCCDSSPSQHATAHFAATGHRVMQSFEPGDNWFWDFEVGSAVDHPPLTEPTSHPVDQSAPGPLSKLPADWMDHVR